MAETATGVEPMVLFGRQAEAMERYAITALANGHLEGEQKRIMTDELLRHSRGVQAAVERWRRTTG